MKRGVACAETDEDFHFLLMIDYLEDITRSTIVCIFHTVTGTAFEKQQFEIERMMSNIE